MGDSILSGADARATRDQLLRDGYCIIPGVLHGDALARAQVFIDDFLDTHPIPHRFRFQGSDFPIINEKVVNAYLSGERPLLEERRPFYTRMTDELLDNPVQKQVCDALGLENMTHGNTALILSKPAHGPALYWHQDGMVWNHPKSGLPWPTKIFLSYYMVDTTPHNGCLRVIPGTHLHRIDLHDELPDAHEEELQDESTDEGHAAFRDHPDAIDLAVKAGDLVIADSRVLHAAHPNRSDARRSLLLQWWDVFPYPSMPTWWEGARPPELDMEVEDGLPPQRAPSEFLKD